MKTSSTFYLLVSVLIGSVLSSSNAYAQPANDLIQNAINIGNGPLPFQDVDVDFANATNTGDGGQTTCNTGTAIGVWYKFLATKNGTIAASMVFPINTAIIFYSAPDIFQVNTSNLVYVDQASNPCGPGEFSEIEATANTAYYIFVSNQVNSTFVLTEQDVFEAPANDLIENAISLNNQPMPFVDEDVHFLMATDTNDDGQNGGCETGAERVVWYKFTADQDGMVNAFFEHNVQFNALVFYSAANANATSGADLTYVNQANNPCDYNNEAAIEAEAGTTYYIAAICSQRGYNTVTIDASFALSVNEVSNIEFNYYPNPVDEMLTLNAKTPIQEISLFNINGQKLLNQQLNQTQQTIDLSNFSRGIYMMQVKIDGNWSTHKVIKK